MPSLYFQPVMDSYLIVGALAVALVALLWLRPTFGQLPPRRRYILVALRSLVSLLILFALLRPTVVLTTNAPFSASLVLLFDVSRSMQLQADAGQRSRYEEQRQLLLSAQKVLADLGKQFDIKVYAYDQQLHPVARPDGRLQIPAESTGNVTDIGASLDSALRAEMGKRLAAVFLMGDGVQTAQDPQVEIHEAARELARNGTPLFTIVFGRSGNEEQSRDVSVENLPEQITVFVKNELAVRGVVRVRGYANQAIPVELVLQDPTGQEKVVATRTLTGRADGQPQAIELSFTPDTPGQFKLTLRVPEQSGELVTKNNSLTAFLTVLEGGLKVVYMYGNLVGEQRYLRWSLDSSPDIELRHIFIDPRNRARWPDDRSELLRDNQFDVIMIEDVDAAAFRPEDLTAVAKAVENGRGLIMIGGYHSFGAGGFYNTPLRDVLPIAMNRLDRQDVNPLSEVSSDLHITAPQGLVMLPARPHPIMRLADESQNEEVWRRLPPLTGANLFRRLKDNAQVLAESSSKDPLLVSAQYGKGRVLAFAGDSTYRWWQLGHQPEHKRFWRQIIMWLAQRENDDRNDVWIKLLQRRYSPNTDIHFTTGARTTSGDPIAGASLTATLVAPDGQRSEISLTPREQENEGELRKVTAPGDYLIEVTAVQGTTRLGSAQAVFQVLDRDLELANPAADPDQLARIAAITKDAGGRLLAPEQFTDVLRELKKRIPQEKLEVQRRWRLADTWWDAWLFFLVLVAALGTEWGLRKKWGMV